MENEMIPDVTILIPNFNHERYLVQRIESVLLQTYENFEVIILDDCSTDSSKTIIENFRGHEKIRHIEYNKENSGSTFKQWEKGIALARGKFIWIAESDDYCEHDFLEKILQLYQQDKNIGIAYAKSLPVDGEGNVYDRSDWWMKRVDPKRWENNFHNNGQDECRNYLAVQCTIPNVSAVVFSAESLENIDWKSISFKVCGDWYVYVQILSTYDISYSAEPLNYHRNHSNNARNTYRRNIISEQYCMLSLINRNFEINKTRAFYKSLDERMEGIVSMVKSGSLPFSNALKLARAMRHFDPLFILRIIKILTLKAFKIKINFD